MDLTTRRDESLKAHEQASAAVADLLRSLDRTDVQIPGSAWTVRDAAAHLVNFCGVYVEMARGNPPRPPEPAHWAGRQRRLHDADALAAAVARLGEELLADVPEDDPSRLARLVTDASGRFVEELSRRSADAPVEMYWGHQVSIADLAGILLAEPLLHGFDMAAATRRPWHIDPGHATLALLGCIPALPYVVRDEPSRGLAMAYEVTLTGVAAVVVRFSDGVVSTELPGAPVDGALEVDPVTWMLIRGGRLTLPQALTCGLVRTTDPVTALALDALLRYP